MTGFKHTDLVNDDPVFQRTTLATDRPDFAPTDIQDDAALPIALPPVPPRRLTFAEEVAQRHAERLSARAPWPAPAPVEPEPYPDLMQTIAEQAARDKLVQPLQSTKRQQAAPVDPLEPPPRKAPLNPLFDAACIAGLGVLCVAIDVWLYPRAWPVIVSVWENVKWWILR